jgi:hypothetical protein
VHCDFSFAGFRFYLTIDFKETGELPASSTSSLYAESVTPAVQVLFLLLLISVLRVLVMLILRFVVIFHLLLISVLRVLIMLILRLLRVML